MLQKLNALLVGAALTVGAVGAQTRFTVIDTGVNFIPVAIGQGGMMAGQAGNQSYAWSARDGLFHISGFEGYYDLYAWDVNGSGQVVGESNGAAFVWDRVNGAQRVVVGSPGFSRAFGINDLGHIVGGYLPPEGVQVAFLYTPGGAGLTNLQPLIPGKSAEGLKVNNYDEVLGGAQDETGNDVAVLWQPDGSVANIGNLLTQYQNNPFGLNDLGAVCGGTFGPLGNIGYFRDPNGTYTPIYDPYNPVYFTEANSLNNHNVVVGAMAGLVGNYTGFLWTAQSGVTVLNNVLMPGFQAWDIRQAMGINDSGQIAAYAYLNGQPHAVLLTPVTLPSPSPILPIHWLR